jgi:L,D-transpeptidase ErfK/SrfK
MQMQRLTSLIFLTFIWLLVAVPVSLAATFALPPENGDIIGEMRFVVASESDTLLDIARRYGLGYNEITRANPGVDPWLPKEGTYVILPTQFVLPKAPRRGLVLNIPQMRLFYFIEPKNGQPGKVITHPMGIGREYLGTPYGRTSITSKRKDPTWYPPESIRKSRAEEGITLPAFVPPGPSNPLGKFAMNLGMPGYLIHGTNKPWGIGRRVSHGCIRLYPEDIESLFQQIPIGTPVEIVHQPHVAGWHQGQLYLQTFPPLSEHEQSLDERTAMMQVVLEKVSEDESIDWDRATTVLQKKSGIPTPILDGAPDHTVITPLTTH